MENISFKKPNQLINMDKTDMTLFQKHAMDKMLKLAQNFIYINKDIPYEKLLEKVYYVDAWDILDLNWNDNNYDSVKNKRAFMTNIIPKVNAIGDIKLRPLDIERNNYGVLPIFSYCTYEKESDRFYYQINTIITRSFYYNTSLILPIDLFNKDNIKPYYTEIDINKNINMGFKYEPSYHVWELISMHMGIQRNKTPLDIKPMSVDTFKEIIGIKPSSYKGIADFRNKVMNKIYDDFTKNNHMITLNVKGRGKSKYVYITYYGLLKN